MAGLTLRSPTDTMIGSCNASTSDCRGWSWNMAGPPSWNTLKQETVESQLDPMNTPRLSCQV